MPRGAVHPSFDLTFRESWTPKYVTKSERQLRFHVGEARKMLELAALPPDTELLPLRYRYMAVEAYLEGDISEGQFARFLRTDRTTARGLAQQLSHRIGMDETGAVSEEKLGYLEGADVAIG
jgi:hypothetical protein